MIVLGLIFICILFCLIRFIVVRSFYHFQCQNCHQKWKPSFFQVMGNISHYVNHYHVKCPYCHQVQNIRLSKRK